MINEVVETNPEFSDDSLELSHAPFPGFSEILGAILSVVPFVMSSVEERSELTTFTGADGQVVVERSVRHYIDYVAVGGGVAALLAAIFGLALVSRSAPKAKVIRLLVNILLLGLAAFQLLRGFGLVRS